MHQEPREVGSTPLLVGQLTAKMTNFKQRRLRVLDGPKKMIEMSVSTKNLLPSWPVLIQGDLFALGILD